MADGKPTIPSTPEAPASTGETAPTPAERPESLSPLAQGFRRFRRNRPAVAGAIILATMLLTILISLPAAIVGRGDLGSRADAGSEQGSLLDLDPEAEPDDPAQPPGLQGGLLGTDGLGRSVWQRMAYGGALSLLMGFSAAAIAVVIGTSVGLLAGFVGGRLDALLMRFVDVLYGLPYVLMAALLMATLREPFRAAFGFPDAVVFVAIGLLSWLTMARVVRAEVLSIRSRPFIEAATAAGIPAWRVMVAHLLPNLVSVIIVYAALVVPQAILQESFLSFLGLGVGPENPTWGQLASEAVREGFNSITLRYWWLTWPPCIALALTLLSLNFIGDGLRDAFDPRSERG